MLSFEIPPGGDRPGFAGRPGAPPAGGLGRAARPAPDRQRRAPRAPAHAHPDPLDRDRRPGVHDRARALLARVPPAALAAARRGRAVGADQSGAHGRVRRDHPPDRAQRRAPARLRHPAARVPSGTDRRLAESVLDPPDRAGHPVRDHPVAAHDHHALPVRDRGREPARALPDGSALVRRHVPPAAALLGASWLALVLGTAR